MKRIIAVMLIVMLIFSGCGEKEALTTDVVTTKEVSNITESIAYTEPTVSTSSLSVEPSECEIVSELPSPIENALLEGGPVGGLPRFYVFEEGLTYYVNEIGLPDDITLRRYSKCELDLPSGYTDAKIVGLGSGGGSGEATITVKAMRDGKETYIDYYFYCEDITMPEFVQELDYVPEL